MACTLEGTDLSQLRLRTQSTPNCLNVSNNFLITNRTLTFSNKISREQKPRLRALNCRRTPRKRGSCRRSGSSCSLKWKVAKFYPLINLITLLRSDFRLVRVITSPWWPTTTKRTSRWPKSMCSNFRTISIPRPVITSPKILCPLMRTASHNNLILRLASSYRWRIGWDNRSRTILRSSMR